MGPAGENRDAADALVEARTAANVPVSPAASASLPHSASAAAIPLARSQVAVLTNAILPLVFTGATGTERSTWKQ